MQYLPWFRKLEAFGGRERGWHPQKLMRGNCVERWSKAWHVVVQIFLLWQWATPYYLLHNFVLFLKIFLMYVYNYKVKTMSYICLWIGIYIYAIFERSKYAISNNMLFWKCLALHSLSGTIYGIFDVGVYSFHVSLAHVLGTAQHRYGTNSMLVSHYTQYEEP